MTQLRDPWLTHLPKGLVVASEFGMVLTNARYQPNGTRMGFIYCAGKSVGAWGIIGMGPAFELARRGYPVLCGDLGDTPTAVGKSDAPGVWGNAAAVTKLSTHKTFLQGTWGAKAGKIGLLYGSHGCAAAYAWAAANPTLVQMIAGVIGTCDIEDIRANNRNSFQASIETAYTDNATWQTLRATHNPVEVAASLAAVPQLDYYSTDDPICVASTHAALLAAAGSNMTQVSLGAVGHALTGLEAPWGTHTEQVGAFADWCEGRAA